MMDSLFILEKRIALFLSVVPFSFVLITSWYDSMLMGITYFIFAIAMGYGFIMYDKLSDIERKRVLK
jgi:hypothetical protein